VGHNNLVLFQAGKISSLGFPKILVLYVEMLTKITGNLISSHYVGSSVAGINVQSWSFRGGFLKVDRNVEKKTLPVCYDEA